MNKQAKADDFGDEGGFYDGGEVTFVWPDGTMITTDGEGHYNADGSSGSYYSAGTPQINYTNNNFPGMVLENNGLIVTYNNDGSNTQYVYAKNSQNGWSLVSTTNSVGTYTPSPPDQSGAATGGYIANTNGSYTLLFSDGSQVTVNTNGSYTVSSGPDVCTGCSYQAAAAGLPPGIAYPPPLPPYPSQDEIDAYTQMMSLYTAAVHISHQPVHQVNIKIVADDV